MTPRQAQDFIRYYGVVLQSAKGLEPTLTVRIAGGPIRGSWWGHPKSHEIYALLQKIDKSNVVLSCTLAKGRITYVHRRLWPAFVRVAKRFPAHALDKAVQVHLPSGRHQRQDLPFPEWVPETVLSAARKLSVQDASAEIEIWLQRYGTTG
jgi:hypothetical protein